MSSYFKRSSTLALVAVFSPLAVYACSSTDSGGVKYIYVESDAQSGGTGGMAADDASDGNGFMIDAGDSGMVNPDGACVAESAKPTPVPLNMYIMLDRSGSMSGSTWTSATGALKTFVEDPRSADMSVALNYFPALTGSSECDADYATPAVPLSKLSIDPAPIDQAELALSNSLSTVMPTGGTPMGPAFAGALGFSLDTVLNKPNEKTVLVLLTDGDPSTCGAASSAEVKAKIIASAKAEHIAHPNLITFAIGFQGSNEAFLMDLASEGGGESFFLGGSGNVQQDLLDKLVEISGGILGCEYLVPQTAPSGSPVNFGKVSVQFTPGVGSSVELLKVQDKNSCVLNGWYYDDNQNPTKILLCPSTCQYVQNDPQAKVNVLLGCDPLLP